MARGVKFETPWDPGYVLENDEGDIHIIGSSKKLEADDDQN